MGVLRWGGGGDYSAARFVSDLLARNELTFRKNAFRDGLMMITPAFLSRSCSTSTLQAGDGIVSAKVGYCVNHHVSFSLALDNLNNQRYFVFNRQSGRPAFGEFAYRF